MLKLSGIAAENYDRASAARRSEPWRVDRCRDAVQVSRAVYRVPWSQTWPWAGGRAYSKGASRARPSACIGGAAVGSVVVRPSPLRSIIG